MLHVIKKRGRPLEHYFTNNPNLESNIRVLNYQKDNVSFSFFSDNGVFSKEKIDYGSFFLIETFFKNNNDLVKSALDVGCGYGFIAIVLSKLTNIPVDMIDINRRAIHLAERNIKENKVNCRAFESNIYDKVDKKYDLIITNPPIRAGKEVVKSILMNAKAYLNSEGKLWFVMRKDHGVKSMIKLLETDYNLEIVAKSKGFYVVKAQRTLTK